MNEFFATCKRCLKPWVICLIAVVIIGLIIFVPRIGIASFIAVLPLVGCTVMCGAMALMYKRRQDK